MNLQSPHNRKTPSFLVQWLVVAGILLVLSSVIALVLFQDHRRIEKQERDRLSTQAKVIDENLAHQLDGANQALAGILKDLPRWIGNNDIASANTHLGALADAMPGIRTILITDADGTVVAANREELVGRNFRQRDYFQAPFNNPNPKTLYVSPPYKTILGNFVINVSRMVPGPNGTFDGIVTATLDPDYFNTLLASVRYATDMWITLIHGDGKLFLRAPHQEDAVGKDLIEPGSFFSRYREQGYSAGVLTGNDLFSPDNLMVALRTIKPEGLRMDKPLVVAVGRELQSVFESWRRDLLVKSCLFGSFAVSLTTGMYLFQRRQQTFQRLADEYEAEQRENAQRLKMATGAAGVGVWDYDLKTGRLDWDDSMFTIFGKNPADFTFSYGDWSGCLLPEDLPGAETALRESINECQPFTANFRIRRGDGEVRTIRGMANVHCNEAGKPERMIGVNEDITERIRSEHALRDNERFLKTLTDVIPGMVGYWTHELCCGFANNEYRTWFGKSPEEMLGMHIHDVFGAKLYHEIEPHIQRTLHGERQQLELTLTRPDGKVGHTWTHFIPDSYGGQTLGFYMLVSDVTELKQTQFQLEKLNEMLKQRTEEAVAANTAKSRFLANMSHEIRTPMNAVQGLLHLLQHSGLSPLQQDYVQKIQRASRSLLAILNDILDFSKVEAGKLELEQAPFSLEDVMHNLSVILTSTNINKDVEVLFSIAADLPRSVKGDALRLQQVLLNLAGNAVKFTERGTVQVRVRVANISGEQAEIEFSVQDTGIGIAADKLESIFEDFVQAESSTTRRFGGTGLGLTISQRLVQLMGGKLVVESQPGKGSTFRFTVVFERDTADSESGVTFGHSVTAPVFSAPAGSGDRLQGLRLLVVEDNRINQQVAREVLVLEGAEVEVASSGREGIDRITGAVEPFDAVLMDIQMPDMDGYAATRHIRRTLEMKQLPIIAMTADAFPSDRENCLAAGMNDHIRKPIDVEKLLEVLRLHCGIHTAAGSSNQAASQAAETDPPGFVLREALARLGGNRALHARLSREFVDTWTGTMADLYRYLEQGEYDSALYALHSIRGVAATLGATALSRSAADLEAALRGTADPTAQALLLRNMETLLLGACSTLQHMADEIDRDTDNAVDTMLSTHTPDLGALISSLTRLENLLQSGNMRAADEYREIKLLIGGELPEQLAELDLAMNRLDFPAAAETCRTMREALA